MLKWEVEENLDYQVFDSIEECRDLLNFDKIKGVSSLSYNNAEPESFYSNFVKVNDRFYLKNNPEILKGCRIYTPKEECYSLYYNEHIDEVLEVKLRFKDGGRIDWHLDNIRFIFPDHS